MIVASVVQIVAKHVPRDSLEPISRDLMELLHDAGAEIITDYTRAELGLSPRGRDGWTSEEIIALDQRRLDAMTRPILFPKTGGQQ